MVVDAGERFLVVGADVGYEHSSHARLFGGLDSIDRIFEGEAVFWREVQSLRGEEEGFGVRLSVLDLVAGDGRLEEPEEVVVFKLAGCEAVGGRGGERLRHLELVEEFEALCGACLQGWSVCEHVVVELAG